MEIILLTTIPPSSSLTFLWLGQRNAFILTKLELRKTKGPLVASLTLGIEFKILSFSGIVMMKRLGDDPEEIVKPVELKKNQVETEDEPEPPEAFEYTE